MMDQNGYFPRFFEEDEVAICTSRNLRCGTVIESYADTYSDYEDYSEDDEHVKPGKVRIAFYPTGLESIVDESKIQLIERSLMPGDIVRRLDGSSSQKGYVTDSTVMCYLQVKGTNQIISRVDSRLLRDCFEFGSDTVYVEFDGWIGKTHNNQTYRVTIDFCDGARCTVDRGDLDEFDDAFDTLLRKRADSEFTFTDHYRHQKLRGTLGSINVTAAEWIKTTNQFGPSVTKTQKKKTVVVTVVDIHVSKISVQWLYCGISSNANSSSIPGKDIHADQLHKLRLVDPFIHATAQIGDTFYYTLQSSDNIEVINPRSTCCVSQCLLPRVLPGYEPMEVDNGNRVTEEMQAADDSDDVKENNEKASGSGKDGSAADAGDGDADGWEDVDETRTASSSTRGYKSRRGRKKKRGNGLTHSNRSKCTGLATYELKPGQEVAVEIVLTESFVNIMWQNGIEEKDLSSRLLYPVYHLDDNEFFPGDYIMRIEASGEEDQDEYGVVLSVDEFQRVANVKWFYPSQESTRPTCLIQSNDISVYEIRDHPGFKYRPGAAVLRVQSDDLVVEQCCSGDSVGSITKLNCDGLMSVKWADGCESECYPGQLLLVANMHESDDDDDDEEEDDDDYSDDDGEYEVDGDLSSDQCSSRMSSSVSDSIASADGDVLPDEAHLKDLVDSMLSVIKSYERIIESLKEIQLSRTAVPWDDFRKMLNLISKVPRLYKKLTKLDPCLHKRAVQVDIDQFQRKLKKGQIYADVSKSLKAFRCKLIQQDRQQVSGTQQVSDEQQSVSSSQVDQQRMHLIQSLCSACISALQDALLKIPCAETGGESSYITKLKELATLIHMHYVQAPDQCPAGDSVKRSEDSVERSGNSAERSGDSIDSSAHGVGGDSYLHMETKAIVELVDSIEEQAESAQLEVADVICDFFSKMKSITETVVQLSHGCPVKKEEDSVAGASKPEYETLKCDIKTEPVECEAELFKTHQKIELDQEIGPDVKDPFCIPKFHKETQCQGALNSCFQVLDKCPSCHKFFGRTEFSHSPRFIKDVNAQLKILSNSLPSGISVCTFEDRMDCLSALIVGPNMTPYEDTLFIFDIYLPALYPMKPPLVHYHSYVSERLNPNLYVDGMVCVSLLGTWSGKEQELWNPSTSSLLQVLLSIQGLILVKEPYYNEAGYEKQRGTPEGNENSKKYNEMVLLRTVQSMISMLERPHHAFKDLIVDHWRAKGQRFLERIDGLLARSYPTEQTIDYPLLPLSRGCHLSLERLISKFKSQLNYLSAERTT